MSLFGKQGTRCDFCGKFSRNKQTGEYTRKDGSAGYIWPVEGDDSKDICDDCVAAGNPPLGSADSGDNNR